MKLRPSTVADLGEVVEVFDAARATMKYLPVLHTAAETLQYFREQLEVHQSIVAVEREAIVGFAIFGDGWLHHLYVRERGRLIGSALLGAVRRQGGPSLQLWTFQANEGARRFYERHGFVAVELTDGHANEERLPDVRYQSLVDGGAF